MISYFLKRGNPEGSLRTSEAFLVTYGKQKAKAVNHLPDSWQFDADGTREMTVRQFYEWYQECLLKHESFAHMKETSYLTDIPIEDGDLNEWRRSSVPIDVLSED